MWYIPTNMNYPKPFILKKYFFLPQVLLPINKIWRKFVFLSGFVSSNVTAEQLPSMEQEQRVCPAWSTARSQTTYLKKIILNLHQQWLLSCFVHGQYYNQIMRNSSLTHGPARIAQAPGLCSKPVEQSPSTSHKIFKSTLMSPSSEPVKRTSPAKTAHSMSSECLSQSAATAEI